MELFLAADWLHFEAIDPIETVTPTLDTVARWRG